MEKFFSESIHIIFRRGYDRTNGMVCIFDSHRVTHTHIFFFDSDIRIYLIISAFCDGFSESILISWQVSNLFYESKVRKILMDIFEST